MAGNEWAVCIVGWRCFQRQARQISGVNQAAYPVINKTDLKSERARNDSESFPPYLAARTIPAACAPKAFQTSPEVEV